MVYGLWFMARLEGPSPLIKHFAGFDAGFDVGWFSFIFSTRFNLVAF